MKKLSKRAIHLFALTASFLLFTICALVSTFSKYVTTTNAPFKGEEYLDYTVNSVFVVKNQEELFAAINQGYGYLQMDKNIENPLIITEKAETLNSDLILDLNGIELQRNGYEPILNIKENVRLTVVDTSEEGTGALYNPVGSVFNITGGTLTIVDGAFESGPRYSEYYSYNSKVLNGSDGSQTKRTLVKPNAENVIMHTRLTEEQQKAQGETFSAGTTTTAPIIKSYPEQVGEIVYKHGNLYFDEALTRGAVTIKPDTYCYYRTSEDIALELSDTSMADWYYTYYVNPETFEYVGVAATKAEDIKITIYGYENTIQKAMGISEPKDYYAAIQMQSGVLDVKQGVFNTYFGVDTTACVNAQGGTIDVAQGSFSSRSPNAYSFTQNGVNVKEDDALAFGEGYFNNYQWATGVYEVGSTKYYGNLAKRGEAHCILNAGSADVTIKKGTFYSSNNNIVSMENGKLDVGGGTFTKRLTNGLRDDTKGNVAKMSAIYMAQGELGIANATCTVLGDQTNGLYMLDGTLNVQKTDYNITGDHTKGIQMLYGKLSVTGGTCSIVGDTTYGIYSTVSGAGNFQVTDTSFNLTGGNNQTGIYAENSQIVLTSSSNTSAVGAISIEGDNAKGIHVVGASSVVDSNAYTYGIVGDRGNGIHMEDGTLSVNQAQYLINGVSGIGINMNNGILTVQTATYDLDGAESIGIKMESGKLNVSDATCKISGNKVYGIYSTVSGEGNFIVEDTTFTLTDGTEQTGIYAENGKIQLTNTQGDNSFIDVEGNSSKGLFVKNGAIESNGYNYTLAGTNSYGIYSEGGAIQVNDGNINLASNQSCYGVYALAQNGEDLDIRLSGADVSVGYDSTNNKTSGTNIEASIGVYMATNNSANAVELTNANVYSYEVGVALSGGQLNMYGDGEIKTKKASAVVVLSGDLTFEENSGYVLESYATRDASTITSASNRTVYNTNAYTITLPKLNGNTLSNVAYDNFDGIYVDNGTFTSKGELALTHTGLRNYAGYNNYTGVVITSYAVRVVGDNGRVNITKGNIQANAGGGIYSSGGQITMGNSTTTNDDIIVQANGRVTNDTEYHAIIASQGSWQNEKSLTGGNAIELAGGNIEIYSGLYEAQFGNGVAANSDGNITIYNGTFYGWMKDDDNDMIPKANSRKSGPSAHYGLKVVGGATVNIYGGVYDGGNGGAFVTGIDKNAITFSSTKPTSMNTSGKERAKVYVYAGQFGGTDSVKDNWALDGFNVYDYSNVVFGAYTRTTTPYTNASQYKAAIQVKAQNASIATNPITNGVLNAVSTNVSVYYGTYTGDSGIWSGNSTPTVYNTNNAVGYTQSTKGGTIRNNTTAEFFSGQF